MDAPQTVRGPDTRVSFVIMAVSLAATGIVLKLATLILSSRSFLMVFFFITVQFRITGK